MRFRRWEAGVLPEILKKPLLRLPPAHRDPSSTITAIRPLQRSESHTRRDLLRSPRGTNVDRGKHGEARPRSIRGTQFRRGRQPPPAVRIPTVALRHQLNESILLKLWGENFTSPVFAPITDAHIH